MGVTDSDETESSKCEPVYKPSPSDAMDYAPTALKWERLVDHPLIDPLDPLGGFSSAVALSVELHMAMFFADLSVSGEIAPVRR
jgi:hypothetical protein